MLEASYAYKGMTVVFPTNLRIGAGEHAAHTAEDARGAEALAMMASALLRPTGGAVLIGEYDPRVQPAHCKRIAAFVPHDPLPLNRIDAGRFIDYRAALWDIDRAQARAHARRLLERLDGLHEAFAYPVVAALLPSPQLLVLDRPQPQNVAAIATAAGSSALLIVQSRQ
jgi:ABC-type multidrug transport system ATPase subunit